ncbi:MAG TPA: DUF1844 domain-containing protein [Candidatus Brocadiales bacterium]|nr:DUF1844 domain-containing protein [Candidatus Brocadiales bacterium]
MAEEKDKIVDEEWKRHVEEEKEREAEEEAPSVGGGPDAVPEASFILFISSLATQALMALGEIENPMTGKREKNLAQAKFTIDTLVVIEEKTRGNLTPEEQRYLEGVLYDLKMSFVNSTQTGG